MLLATMNTPVDGRSRSLLLTADDDSTDDSVQDTTPSTDDTTDAGSSTTTVSSPYAVSLGDDDNTGFNATDDNYGGISQWSIRNETNASGLKYNLTLNNSTSHFFPAEGEQTQTYEFTTLGFFLILTLSLCVVITRRLCHTAKRSQYESVYSVEV